MKSFEFKHQTFALINTKSCHIRVVDSGGAGGARAPSEFGGSEKGRSLISAYRSLAITTNTPGFKKLSTALIYHLESKISNACFTYHLWSKDDFNLCDSTGRNLFIQEKGVRKKLNFPGGEPKSKKIAFLYSPMTKAANDTIDNLDKTLQEFYRQLCNKSDVDNYSVGKSFMKNPYQWTLLNTVYLNVYLLSKWWLTRDNGNLCLHQHEIKNSSYFLI